MSAPDQPGVEIHPYEKSVTHYLTVGYGLVTGIGFPAELDDALDIARGLDASALVIDDILDESTMRAGGKALHELIGVKAAMVEGIAMHGKAVDAVAGIAERLGTPHWCQAQILRRLNGFLIDMYTGQQLDLDAREDLGFHPAMVERYFRIIFLITAAHVRLGLECGQLLAGRQPDPDVTRAGEALGLLRQMFDDFDDYFDEHHEPFGDFTLGLNRLPELLFKQDGGDRVEVLRAIDEGRADDVRSLVLTPVVRQGIYGCCARQAATANRLLTPGYADADLKRIVWR